MTPAELALYLTRPKLNWNWKIEPEQRLSIEFSDALRAASVDGKYKGVWTHVPNEGKRHQITACIMKAMGMIPGVYDYNFMWGETGRGVIELKAGSNKPTEHQIRYKAWCDMHGIPNAVCYSVDEALGVLKEWGALS